MALCIAMTARARSRLSRPHKFSVPRNPACNLEFLASRDFSRQSGQGTSKIEDLVAKICDVQITVRFVAVRRHKPSSDWASDACRGRGSGWSNRGYESEA